MKQPGSINQTIVANSIRAFNLPIDEQLTFDFGKLANMSQQAKKQLLSGVRFLGTYHVRNFSFSVPQSSTSESLCCLL
jgi:hypothetical protein